MTNSALPRAIAPENPRALRSAHAIDLTDPAGRSDVSLPRFGAFVAKRDDELGEASRSLERAVFAAEFAMSSEEHAERYDRYDDSSLFFGVRDNDDGAVIGAARVVLPSALGLLTVQDMRTTWAMSDADITHPVGAELALDRVWDIATLAVVRPHRRGVASWTLYQAVCTSARRCAVAGFVAILDIPVQRMLNWSLKGLFRTYDVAPALYAGSISVPVWSDLTAYQRRLRVQSPRLYERLFHEGERFDREELHLAVSDPAATPARR